MLGKVNDEALVGRFGQRTEVVKGTRMDEQKVAGLEAVDRAFDYIFRVAADEIKYFVAVVHMAVKTVAPRRVGGVVKGVVLGKLYHYVTSGCINDMSHYMVDFFNSL